MTGELFRAGTGTAPRKAALEPPGLERVAGAFRRSGRWLTGIGLATAAAGLAFLVAAITGIAGAAWPVFVSAGGFVLALALLPLVLGYRRLRRVAFLANLRARWVHLDRAGDPHDQVATLRRAYGGLIANDLQARVAAR